MSDKFNIYHRDDCVSANAEMPDLKDITVTGYNLLIQPVNVREELDSGFKLAEQTVEDAKYLQTVGKVVAMGEECYKNETMFTDIDPKTGLPKPWCQVGDYVVYGRNRGQRVYVRGNNLVLLTDHLVLLKIPNADDVDPYYNINFV